MTGAMQQVLRYILTGFTKSIRYLLLMPVYALPVQRLGAIGDGWKVSLTTLMNERLAVGDASGPDFEEAFSLARGQDLNGKLAIENDAVREKLADWYCQQSGLKYAKYRNFIWILREIYEMVI